jgi:hypothetical protein
LIRVDDGLGRIFGFLREYCGSVAVTGFGHCLDYGRQGPYLVFQVAYRACYGGRFVVVTGPRERLGELRQHMRLLVRVGDGACNCLGFSREDLGSVTIAGSGCGLTEQGQHARLLIGVDCGAGDCFGLSGEVGCSVMVVGYCFQDRGQR